MHESYGGYLNAKIVRFHNISLHHQIFIRLGIPHRCIASTVYHRVLVGTGVWGEKSDGMGYSTVHFSCPQPFQAGITLIPEKMTRELRAGLLC